LVFVFVQSKEWEGDSYRAHLCLGGDAFVRWVRGNFFFFGPGPWKSVRNDDVDLSDAMIAMLFALRVVWEIWGDDSDC
jgi:hypothetical protein